jgi:hypothetical protein
MFRGIFFPFDTLQKNYRYTCCGYYQLSEEEEQTVALKHHEQQQTVLPIPTILPNEYDWTALVLHLDAAGIHIMPELQLRMPCCIVHWCWWGRNISHFGTATEELPPPSCILSSIHHHDAVFAETSTTATKSDVCCPQGI